MLLSRIIRWGESLSFAKSWLGWSPEMDACSRNFKGEDMKNPQKKNRKKVRMILRQLQQDQAPQTAMLMATESSS